MLNTSQIMAIFFLALPAVGSAAAASSVDQEHHRVAVHQRYDHGERIRNNDDAGRLASINQWQERLQRLIKHGNLSGELSKQEVRHLQAEQREIAGNERRYTADGRLSRFEWTDLVDDLNKAQRHIYNATHNRFVHHQTRT